MNDLPVKTKSRKPYRQVLVSRVIRNPEQPRKIFDQVELDELAQSIREHGVIQPIVVEACADDYILHDGERRLRAAVLAGLKKIPAIVTPPLNGTGPRERLERALVANVQRVEMHQIEEGYAYQRMITEFGYSVEQIHKRTGKTVARVYACLQLLTLEPEIQQLMLERKLPCAETGLVAEMLRLPAGEERVKLLTALAERGATAKMIREAVHRYLMAKGAARARKSNQHSPAEEMVSQPLPEWDALYQLDKVPPWQVVTDAVMATCDACPVRKFANETTCGDCGLVIGLKRMLEIAHVR